MDRALLPGDCESVGRCLLQDGPRACVPRGEQFSGPRPLEQGGPGSPSQEGGEEAEAQ